MGTLNKELRLVNRMRKWIENIGENTLITGKTFIEVMEKYVNEEFA